MYGRIFKKTHFKSIVSFNLIKERVVIAKIYYLLFYSVSKYCLKFNTKKTRNGFSYP